MITKKLMVKNGSYQKDGEEKNRWLQIGAVHEYEGREYITLDRYVNLAGLPTKDGDTRVFVSMFDNDDSAKPAAAARPRKPAAADVPFDDDSTIPF
jgi:hypothetical protein